ncbi:MAG: GGDEF domain-containing protein [Treponema sp.]|nr:GGDEF domain-containing protein [Treponema sp.]
METAFKNNISALRWANLVFFSLAALFSIFPIITEKAFIKAIFYLGSAVAALTVFIIATCLARQSRNNQQISKTFIYALILIYYLNVMFFGFYLAVWAEPGKIAGSFIGIFICVLFLYNISPLLYLSLTLISLGLYIAAIILVKTPAVWNYDIQNAFFAAALSLIFGWQIIMNRITMMSNARKLREGSTIDELTNLKNRRDFMNTFQRFLVSPRQSENILCIALVDIDYFKDYNDYYGHKKGDECLRKIGAALNTLSKAESIYAARVDGGKFALLWHTAKSENAGNVGSRLNQIIRDINIPHEKSKAASCITVSIGIHAAICNNSHDIKDLYSLAEKALNTAKDNGRNCTVVN